jgi:hypothetical protein
MHLAGHRAHFGRLVAAVMTAACMAFAMAAVTAAPARAAGSGPVGPAGPHSKAKPVPVHVGAAGRITPNCLICNGKEIYGFTMVDTNIRSVNYGYAPDTSFAIAGTLTHYVSEPIIDCWESGQQVQGYYGWSTVWDHLSQPYYDNDFLGLYAFVTDMNINTGGDTSKMVPQCW